MEPIPFPVLSITSAVRSSALAKPVMSASETKAMTSLSNMFSSHVFANRRRYGLLESDGSLHLGSAVVVAASQDIWRASTVPGFPITYV
jgi:hypothetical protein